MSEAKKRGANYTPAEKESLLSIINEYKHIIENKETNAVFSKKKMHTWNIIAQKYNAQSVTGPRTGPQLKHLYDNLKQRARKNVALENRTRYESILDMEYTNTNEENSITHSQLKDIQKKAVDDKKGILKTGGGSFKTTLTDADSQILAIMGPQINPLPNPFDDAALYFGDATGQEAIVNIPEEHLVEVPLQISVQNVKEQTDKADEDKSMNKTKEKQNIGPSKSSHKENNRLLGIQKNPNSKQKYFNVKLKNALMERKFLILKNKRETSLFKLKMQLIHRKLNNTPIKRKTNK